jgi:hypothetical protein
MRDSVPRARRRLVPLTVAKRALRADGVSPLGQRLSMYWTDVPASIPAELHGGDGVHRLRTAGTAKATLELTGAGKQRIPTLRRAKLTIKITVTSAGGTAVTGRKTVTVKR